MIIAREKTESRTLTALTAAALVLACSLCVAADDSRYAAVYSRNFSTEGFDNLCLEPFGKGATSLMRESGDGLRVSLPRGPEISSVGLAPRFIIRGDCRVTVEYEIRVKSEFSKGSGVGPAIYLTTANEMTAELSRIRTPSGEDLYSTFARAVVDGEPRKSARKFPTDTVQGQLRVRRAGRTLHFETRPDWNEGPFEEIDEMDFSEDDLTLLRLAVKRSDPNAVLQVVFRKVEICAAELPHLPSSASRTGHLYRPSYHPPVSSIRLLTPPILLATAGVVVIAAGLWFRWGRR